MGIFVEAGTQRTVTLKRKGEELFTITIDAKKDVTADDLLNLIDTILNPESIEVDGNKIR